MLFVITAEDFANSLGELVSAEQPLGLSYLAFAMNPLGSIALSHGLWWATDTALSGPHGRHSFDTAVVGADPTSDLMAFVPACVVPDKKQSLLTPLLEVVAAPRKKLRGYGAHGSTIHEPQPSLLKLRQIQPVAGKSLRVGIVLSLASFSSRRTGFPASAQECILGLAQSGENQLSSSKPRAHSGRASARRISRSRSPFFGRTVDRGSRSNALPAASPCQGAPR